MPAFQAINLQPEENVDEQIDTTKELHVDEALKRFQNALKLQAQGVRSRQAANAAYNELFESEIFKYHEARTEYERAELQSSGRPEVLAPELFSEGLDIGAGGADGVAANLSLALYLSFKNYGHFFLDKLKDSFDSDPQWQNRRQVYYKSDGGNKILDNWTAALDQDPSDPELWRKVARISAAMNSGRIRRYCLEAAIELDDDPTVMEVEPPSLAEGLAGEELKGYLQCLGDELALSHPVMVPWLRKQMPALIKRHLDPIPFLPDPTMGLRSLDLTANGALPHDHTEDLLISEGESTEELIASWSDLGSELIKCAENTSGALQACEHLKAKLRDTDVERRENGTDGLGQTMLPEDEKASDVEQHGDGPTAASQPKSKDQSARDNVDDDTKAADKERSSSISTRKRSQSAAGLPDGVEEENVAEKRSKRVRRRVETAHAEEHTDPSTLIANQLRDCQEADQCLFQITKNALETLGIEDKDTFQHLNETSDLCVAEDRNSKFTRLTAKDLRSLIADFDAEIASVFISKKEQASLSLSSFLEHAKTGSQDRTHTVPFNEEMGLKEFVDRVSEHSDRMTSEDIAFAWLRAISPSYTSFKWSDKMKTAVVQMLESNDPFLYRLMLSELEEWPASADRLPAYEAMIPMILELRIDGYEGLTNPGSNSDYATRIDAKYRLERWVDIASVYVLMLNKSATDAICLRFMWASVMMSSLSEKPVREHILLLWTSLRDFLAQEDLEPIHLPNNMVMPTISPAAADREISKLTAMDFFLGLFQEGMEDPVKVIETLEPVLNPSTVCVHDENAASPATQDKSAPDENDDVDENVDDDDDDDDDQERRPNGKAISDCANQGMRDLWKFLHSSSTELRLFLWSRLGDAYEAIKYPTKRFSCHLKSIEMIVADLESEKYANVPDEPRRLLFIRTLRSLDELLIQALSLALNDNTAFDIIDHDHVQSTASALAKVSCLLHVAFLCEDEIRIGVTTAPSSNSTFQSLITKLREMQVRAWCLQYAVFKASFPLQNSLAPEKDLADFLAAVHQVIGLRKGCKVSNKIFLKVMRMELLKNSHIENWEDYLDQVIYDLYGLKLGVGDLEVQDHGCPTEKLEKRQAMQLVEKVMILANRMPIKDLLKSDLRTTIEQMQKTIGQTKSTSQMVHNLRNFTEMLKKPIHPLRLYQALSGGVSVDAVTSNTPEAALARHGWFFLLGMIAFTKFSSVDLNRRQIAGATDDLRVAATFLRLQLQYTADCWEAWFRLAECFDFELDEAVLWSADKINKDRPELVKFQRNAIHCYTLALSHSRHQDVSTNDGDPLHDLYHNFGMRLYASSREPFAMEPFQHSDHERFFIESVGAGTFKRILHEQMSEYKVWKFAAKLFKMAMEREPGNWKNPYMLAKCYWKMYQTPDEKLEEMDQRSRINDKRVIDALQKAINVAYNARKSRHSDPILEPHYKIVSILHKMVIRGDIAAKEAATILSEQPFGVSLGSDGITASFDEPKDWKEYILLNLAKLREKDRSNWQHRIVERHARILFDENIPAEEEEKEEKEEEEGGEKGDEGDEGGNGEKEEGEKDTLKAEVKAAFGILRENMFTKTMVMNVWKCDVERPGRHHVYTEQYVRYMTKLLVIMSDRANLEQLLRRLRKKGADFYHFTDLWQSCFTAFLKLLRQEHGIPHLSDETFKSTSSEEFEIVSERITEWAADEEADVPAFICMKEAIEMKKLNANLMKAAAIDDLISDCYAKIYQDVASSLPGLEPSKIIEERNNHAKEIAAQLEAAAQGEPKPSSSLNNILNMPNSLESVTGSATPLDADKTETAPKVRKSGVRKSEILRKAEQAVARSVEVPKTAHTRNRVGSLSDAKRGSHTPNAGASDAESDDEGPSEQIRREAAEDLDADMEDTQANEDGGEEGEGGDDSKMEEREGLESEAGSIHDDADDESDLSDVPEGYDDDVPPGLLFPNLIPTILHRESAGSSGEDADSESEGDEAEESDGTADDRGQTVLAEEKAGKGPNHGYGNNGTLGNRRKERGVDEDTAMAEAETTTFSVNEPLEMGH